MTIDISMLADKRAYIENFYALNSDLMIEGINLSDIESSTDLKDAQFAEINSSVEIDIESF